MGNSRSLRRQDSKGNAVIVIRAFKPLIALALAILPSIALAAPCPAPLTGADCVPPLVDDWWCDGNAYTIGGPTECESNPASGLHCPDIDYVERTISENWQAHEHCAGYYDVLQSDWFVDSGFDIPYEHNRRFDVHLVSPHDPPAEDFCERDTNEAHEWCVRWVHCPDGYQSALSYGIKACYRVGGKPLDPDKNLGPCPASTGGSPKTANPINIGVGNKYLPQVDVPETSGGLKFERSYNSMNAAPNTTMGAGWQHDWDLRLNVVPIGGVGNLFSGTASARRADGRLLVFRKLTSAGTWSPDPDVTDRLLELTTGGSLSGYQLIDGTHDRIETYDLSGLLTSIEDRRSARTFTFAYDTSARLTVVTDRNDRSLHIDYDNSNRVAAVWGPEVIYGAGAGPTVTYAYSGSGRLDSATWRGGPTRNYWYENASFPYALTGITDENGSRYVSYGYDTHGRGASENLWAGPSQTAPASQYALTYPGGNVTHVVDPLGQQRDYQFDIIQGVAVLASVSAPCSSCGDSGMVSSRTYDPATGFTDLVTDFNGNVTDHDYDSRGLETKRIDVSNDASPQSPKRTTETVWNPTFRVPDQRALKNVSGARVADKMDL
jgi:YD repeat-containing protein